MQKEFISIAIDGPAGAGKSTIAKLVAKKQGFIYVDTGAMYRAMAVYFLRNGINAEETEKREAACEGVSVTIRYENNEQQVILNGENVTHLLRTEEVGKMASASSVVPKVRLKLVELQRKLAATANVVMDGRDIGTYVLPDAQVKIYMTAGIRERALRRFEELKQKGIESYKDNEKVVEFNFDKEKTKTINYKKIVDLSMHYGKAWNFKYQKERIYVIITLNDYLKSKSKTNYIYYLTKFLEEF